MYSYRLCLNTPYRALKAFHVDNRWRVTVVGNVVRLLTESSRFVYISSLISKCKRTQPVVLKLDLIRKDPDAGVALQG
jgi:hypothetical protein